MNFDEAPLLVIWETTQACDLACVHCRASAVPSRHSGELTTAEARQLLDQVRQFGKTMFVFTGGDPLKRPDLFELMQYSIDIGLRTNVSPSATPLLTNQVIDKFKAIGLARMAISLDGATAASHDAFRGIPGTFDRAIEALRHAREIGLETQLQTTVTRRNKAELPKIAELVESVGGRMWSLFFLIDIGRASSADDLTADEYEDVFQTIYRISKTASFELKTTEAMHYRRFVAQRMREEGRAEESEGARRVAFRTAGVSDGRGFVFVSHLGDIYPSGFLPVYGGNIHTDSLVDVYRTGGLFRRLRDPGQREGKCGACEYVKICGGSRSRAYAATGNYLAEDPKCAYQPAAMSGQNVPA